MGNSNCCVNAKKKGQSKHKSDNQQFQKKYYEDIPEDIDGSHIPNNDPQFLSPQKQETKIKSNKNNSKKVFKKNNGISLQSSTEKENQQTLTREEQRQKMIEAAEKRIHKSEFRGVNNKDSQIEQQFQQQKQILAQKYQNNNYEDQSKLKWD